MKPREKPPSCIGCPAYEIGVGFVPSLVPRKPTRIAFIGQGPGELEAMYSEPFLPTAPAGRTLTEWIYLADLQRTEVLIGNVVQCWLPEYRVRGLPKGNRAPTAEERNFCYSQHLGPELRRLGLDGDDAWIFSIGSPSSEFFLGEPKVEKYLGTVTQKSLPLIGETP